MQTYLFHGVILPERAQISLNFEVGFTHLTSGDEGRAKVSIILNQLSVTVDTKTVWDIHDLRNVVKNIIQNHLAMIGYLKGCAYDFEVTRVLNPPEKIDYVFGIDIPCLARSRESIDLDSELNLLKTKTAGENGIFINRCFNDLVSAMKCADDTAFYCYRAIESLRLHCAVVNELSDKNKKVQWEKFREVSDLNKDEIYEITDSAKAVRHGDVSSITGEGRADMFKKTWNIVSAYLKHI